MGLPEESAIPLNATHRNLGKFRSPDDEGYRIIVAALHRMLGLWAPRIQTTPPLRPTSGTAKPLSRAQEFLRQNANGIPQKMFVYAISSTGLLHEAQPWISDFHASGPVASLGSSQIRNKTPIWAHIPTNDTDMIVVGHSAPRSVQVQRSLANTNEFSRAYKAWPKLLTLT